MSPDPIHLSREAARLVATARDTGTVSVSDVTLRIAVALKTQGIFRLVGVDPINSMRYVYELTELGQAVARTVGAS